MDEKSFTIERVRFQNMTISERRRFESFVTGCALGFSGTILGTRIEWRESIKFSTTISGGMRIEYK